MFDITIAKRLQLVEGSNDSLHFKQYSLRYVHFITYNAVVHLRDLQCKDKPL